MFIFENLLANRHRGSHKVTIDIKISQNVPITYICLVWVCHQTQLNSALPTHFRIVVRLDRWDTNSNYPNGHFVQSLGPIGDLETETQTILIEHNLAHRPFTNVQVMQLTMRLFNIVIDLIFCFWTKKYA